MSGRWTPQSLVGKYLSTWRVEVWYELFIDDGRNGFYGGDFFKSMADAESFAEKMYSTLNRQVAKQYVLTEDGYHGFAFKDGGSSNSLVCIRV